MFRIKINQILCLIIIAILSYIIYLENNKNTISTNQVESFIDMNNDDEFFNISNQSWFEKDEWTVVNPMDHVPRDYHTHNNNWKRFWTWQGENKNNLKRNWNHRIHWKANASHSSLFPPHLIRRSRFYPWDVNHHNYTLGHLDSPSAWSSPRHGNNKEKLYPSITIDSLGNRVNHDYFKPEIVGILVQGRVTAKGQYPVKLTIEGCDTNNKESDWALIKDKWNTEIDSENTSKPWGHYKHLIFPEDKQHFRYVRIIIESWNQHPSMRVGLIVKKKNSYYEVYNPSYNNRSHSTVYLSDKPGYRCNQGKLNSPLAWCAHHHHKNNAWTILSKGGEEINVAGIIIQGKGGSDFWSLGTYSQYPTLINVQTADSNQGPWTFIQNFETGIQPGNFYSCSTGTDHYRILKFRTGAKKCKYVKIIILTYHQYPSMRSGLLLKKDVKGRAQTNSKTFDNIYNPIVKEDFELDKEIIKRENSKQELVLNTFLQ